MKPSILAAIQPAICSGIVKIPIAASIGTPLSYYFVTKLQDVKLDLGDQGRLDPDNIGTFRSTFIR
jgi:hypothetical protein